jgi:hypothetical protein
VKNKKCITFVPLYNNKEKNLYLIGIPALEEVKSISIYVLDHAENVKI